MTYFIKSGNNYKIADSAALDISDILPGGNYIVKFNGQNDEFYLEGMDEFQMPKKVYGNSNNYCRRIIDTFLDRPASTGVLLSGEKGSGKTLLTKSIAIELKNQKIPTLVINSPFCGDTFNKFVQCIKQPCAILFDEFEKVFDEEQQQKILTLLDGVFPSKKLFLLTINDGYIDPHLRNRPGRIYYQINFFGLDAEFIREYCQDNLNDKSQIESIVKITAIFDKFNFDMLQAVVEEMNRYGETASEVMKIVNARIQNDGGKLYKVSAVFNGRLLEGHEFSPDFVKFSPFLDNSRFNLHIYGNSKSPEGEDAVDDLPAFTIDRNTTQTVGKNGEITFNFVMGKFPVVLKLGKQVSNDDFNFDAY